MRTPQTFFSIAQVFQEKYYLALARLEIFSKSRLRLNLGYGKSRLTFADKTPGQGKRKAATPEKLKYLSPLKGGLKPGSTIGYRSTRNVPISEKSGAFIRLASPNESIRKQPTLAGWVGGGVFMRQGLQWKAHSLQARTWRRKARPFTGTPKSSKRKAY